jgi:peptide chain release factor subunit 1
MIRTMTSGVHGKFRAGGQSQRRFEKLREEGVHRFYERVAETANGAFLDIPDLKGIYIGGPGMSKEEFQAEHMLDYRLEEKVIDLVDTDSGGEDGIRGLLFRIQDRLENVRYIEEKKIVQKFLGKIAKDDDLVTYGEADVRDALLKGAIETILLSEAIDTVRVKVKCESCGYTEEHTTKEGKLKEIEEKIRAQDCPQCGTLQLRVAERKPIAEELGEIAESMGTEVEMISTETDEGEMLWKTFGGLAAFLRYAVKQV